VSEWGQRRLRRLSIGTSGVPQLADANGMGSPRIAGNERRAVGQMNDFIFCARAALVISVLLLASAAATIAIGGRAKNKIHARICSRFYRSAELWVKMSRATHFVGTADLPQRVNGPAGPAVGARLQRPSPAL